MSQHSSDIIIERHESILRVQFNRPQKKNALKAEMYNAAREALERADADPTVHVVYITGSEDSFTAGNDLNSFVRPTDPNAAARFITAISKTETPIVAAVNGLAVGVGVTMLLHCDLVYAADHATFNFAFIDLGVVPEAAASYLLPRMVGQRRAAELLMLGERFNAQTAQSIGLVNRVLPLEQLETVAWQKAQQLARKPPEALRQTKMLLKRGTAQVVAETIPFELEIFRERMLSAETQAIMQALLQRKRRK